MPGAVDLDPSKEYSLDAIAVKDEAGNWRAGPDNTQGKQTGQFISEDYAKRARASRKVSNDVKRAMRSNDTSEKVARENRSEYFDAKDKFEKGEIEIDEFEGIIDDLFGS